MKVFRHGSNEKALWYISSEALAEIKKCIGGKTSLRKGNATLTLGNGSTYYEAEAGLARIVGKNYTTAIIDELSPSEEAVGPDLRLEDFIPIVPRKSRDLWHSPLPIPAHCNGRY